MGHTGAAVIFRRYGGGYQNALAERVNGILKNELLLQRPANLEQARKMVDESVKIYNQ